MNNLDFERAETSYNINYDPHAERCPVCHAEDSFECVNEEYQTFTCRMCGYEAEKL